MAYKISSKGFDDLEKQFAKYADKVTPMMKRAIYESAGVVADNVRSSMNKELSPEAAAALSKGLNINVIVAENGSVRTSVGFDGEHDGKPIRLLAAVLESGRSDQSGRKKTHFFSKALRASKQTAIEAAQEEVYGYLEELQKEE